MIHIKKFKILSSIKGRFSIIFYQKGFPCQPYSAIEKVNNTSIWKKLKNL
jgi:hypothetical protein